MIESAWMLNLLRAVEHHETRIGYDAPSFLAQVLHDSPGNLEIQKVAENLPASSGKALIMVAASWADDESLARDVAAAYPRLVGLVFHSMTYSWDATDGQPRPSSADDPQVIRAHEFVLVDVWGRVFAVRRERDATEHPEPRQVMPVGGRVVTALGHLVMTLIPHLAHGDITAVASMLTRLDASLDVDYAALQMTTD